MKTSQNMSSVKDPDKSSFGESREAIQTEDVLRFRVMPYVYEEKKVKDLRCILFIFSF